MQSKSTTQRVKFGDMLQMKHGLLVHGCNAQGVMGGGIAAKIRSKFPNAYEDYVDVYNNEGLEPGDVIFSDIDPAQGLYVVNAITQRFYGSDGKKYVSYEAVYESFKKIFKEAEDSGIEVHYPMIGAGLAGGDWAVIQNCIDAAYNEVVEEHPPTRTLWIFE